MRKDHLVTRAQLEIEGLSTNKIRQLCADGALTRLRRGFYLRGDDAAADDPTAAHRLLAEAAAPGLQPGTVFSHVSAGVLHELPVPLRCLDRLTVLRDGREGGTRSKTKHLRKATLAGSDRMMIGSVPVTSLARTVVDLGRTLGFVDAVAVADAALQHGVSQAELLAVIDGTRQRGNVSARAVVAFADARSGSPGESRCRAVLHCAGLPAPQLQYEIFTDAGEFVGRVDFAWPAQGVVGEYDGAVKYGALLKPGQTPADVMMREKAREERIRGCGFWVVRWAAGDLADVDAMRAGVLRAFEFAPRLSLPPREGSDTSRQKGPRRG